MDAETKQIVKIATTNEIHDSLSWARVKQKVKDVTN